MYACICVYMYICGLLCEVIFFNDVFLKWLSATGGMHIQIAIPQYVNGNFIICCRSAPMATLKIRYLFGNILA